jgi:hypothetical protein
MKYSVTDIVQNMDTWVTEKDCIDLTRLLVGLAEKRSTLRKMLDIITSAHSCERAPV